MQKLIIAIVIVVLLTPILPVWARDGDVPVSMPKWASSECLTTIYKIIQHEAGDMQSDKVFRFMAEQIISDLSRMNCTELTNWRWAIGYYPESKVTDQVRLATLEVALRWPVREFPRCKFIGSMADRKVWAKYGYNTEIGFKHTAGNLTVVGVDCTPTRLDKNGNKADRRENSKSRLQRLEEAAPFNGTEKSKNKSQTNK